MELDRVVNGAKPRDVVDNPTAEWTFMQPQSSTSPALGLVSTPALLLDEARFERNVARLRTRLTGAGVRFRPHLKTAKSIDVAGRVMDGASGPAMVSTLKEADYFAGHGVRDLIYGVGIAPAKLGEVAAIRARHGADLAIVLDSLEQADAVASWCAAHEDELPVLIEIDCDGHRSGISPGDAATLLEIARRLTGAGADLRGVLTHAGGSYDCPVGERLLKSAEAERDAAVGAAEILRGAGFASPIVSVGSTPTAAVACDWSGVTEVRAGVFMFGDLVQAGLATCTVDDIAISVLATVIGRRRARGQIITDAGWMALSRDRGTYDQAVDQGYGLVCDEACRPYGDLLVLQANQEHGLVGMRPGSGAAAPELPIGARVRILPNHACATAAQHDRYHVLSAAGGALVEWPRLNGW